MIEKFRGQYSFLSNFYSAPIEYEGLKFSCTECAFMYHKTDNEKIRSLILDTQDPKEAKRLCKPHPRKNWDKIKLDIMEDLIKCKFTQNEHLKKKLLETGDQEIQEGNWWKDTFWGVDENTKIGENNLGKIIMKIREELKCS